jgi:hypothetical protein
VEVIDAAAPDLELQLADVIEAFPGNWAKWSIENWASCRSAGLIVI